MAWGKDSRQSRGYGAEWDKLRLVILKRDYGICQPCKKLGRPHPGNHVDHIVSKAKAKTLGWTKEQVDAESNLQCINAKCHEAKSKAERGFKDRVTIGIDGYPVSI